jgi:hypothetical protein
VFTGLIRVYQQDEQCFVRVYQYRGDSRVITDEHIELFAECPIQLSEHDTISQFVDKVVDSGRYFALRCQDRATQRVVMVGVGMYAHLGASIA